MHPQLLQLALLLLPSAQAQSVVDFAPDFDAYATSTFSGVDGWLSGTSSDPWSTAVADGVYATVDGNTGTWGSGELLDNHLVYTTDIWEDATFEATMYSEDDDAMGFVFRYQDPSNFYLVFLTNDAAPSEGDGTPRTSFVGARLYRIVTGEATELASSPVTYVPGVVQALRVETRGGLYDVSFDADGSGTIDTDEALFSAFDSTFRRGLFGFWCYENGRTDGNACRFDDAGVLVPDSDDDGTGDPDDCLPFDPETSPDAPEICDGLDQDCDGVVDDGVQDLFHADRDGDGFGDPLSPVWACERPVGTVVDGTDCDDTRATVYPGAPELPDGLDNDCDGNGDPVAPDADSDDDGLLDTEELGIGTDPFDPDTDADGLGDGIERGVATVHPDSAGFVPDADPATTTLPLVRDTDGDTVSDGDEDADHDGAWTATLGGTGTPGSGESDPLVPDTDGDGLTDGEERAAGWSPIDTDTDDGSIGDGTEARRGTDPLDPADDPPASDITTGEAPDPEAAGDWDGPLGFGRYHGGCGCNGAGGSGSAPGLLLALGLVLRRRKSG